MPKARPIILPPIHANEGLEAAYRRKLQRMIEAMHRSFIWWITAAYRANQPELANDDNRPDISISQALAAAIAKEGNSAKAMTAVMKILGAYWEKRYYSAAPKLAEYFAQSAARRVDGALRQILSDSGFIVDWKMTAAQREVMQATIGQQVSLIRSIPEQYYTQVEGMVMRSVAAGGDLATLTKQLGPMIDLNRIRMGRKMGESDASLLARTMRRAAFIAQDQNQKANAMITRERQLSLGITKAVWMHSHAGKTPRPTHVAEDGKTYDIVKGFYDTDEREWVLPGQLPRCRCTSRAILPGART